MQACSRSLNICTIQCVGGMAYKERRFRKHGHGSNPCVALRCVVSGLTGLLKALYILLRWQSLKDQLSRLNNEGSQHLEHRKCSHSWHLANLGSTASSIISCKLHRSPQEWRDTPIIPALRGLSPKIIGATLSYIVNLSSLNYVVRLYIKTLKKKLKTFKP